MSLQQLTINDRQQSTLLAGLRLLSMAQRGHLLASVGPFGDELTNPMDLPEMQDYRPIYNRHELQQLADVVNGVSMAPEDFRVKENE